MDLSYDDSKRRRTTLASPNLVDLPLTAIANYLPSTNRIILAISLTPSSSFSAVCWNNAKLSTASKAVLASKECWGLDFAEISEYAGDPSDEDLRALLLSIDAKNTLKTLNIGRCYKIVGHGLEPLRESTVLQCLSLPYRQVNGVENALSIDIVIPIIVSMINASTNPLDRLDLLRNLPKDWLYGQPRNESPLCEVLTNISQMLLGDEITCIRCEEPCDQVCFTCFEISCNICNYHSDFPRLPCGNCEKTFCDHCEKDMAECSNCESFYCPVCAQLDDVDAALGCSNNDCDNHLVEIDKLCFGCILEGHNEVNVAGFIPCRRCVAMHFPKLTARNRAQQAEIAQLRQQIDQLQL